VLGFSHFDLKIPFYTLPFSFQAVCPRTCKTNGPSNILVMVVNTDETFQTITTKSVAEFASPIRPANYFVFRDGRRLMKSAPGRSGGRSFYMFLRRVIPHQVVFQSCSEKLLLLIIIIMNKLNRMKMCHF
jgi:hypothetical protein